MPSSSKDCAPPNRWVPGYCRKPPQKRKPSNKTRLTKSEKKEIISLINELVPQVKVSASNNISVPETSLPNMEQYLQTLHDMVDAQNGEKEARFTTPLFTLYCFERIVKQKYRNVYPSVDARYDAIKRKFIKQMNVESVPLVYKFILLKLCLEMYA